MKKILSLLILTLLPMLASAQTALDVQNSGCLSKTRGEEAQMEPGANNYPDERGKHLICTIAKL